MSEYLALVHYKAFLLFESQVKTRQSYGSNRVIEKEKRIMPGTRLGIASTTA
jgi:hypothetical protein